MKAKTNHLLSILAIALLSGCIDTAQKQADLLGGEPVSWVECDSCRSCSRALSNAGNYSGARLTKDIVNATGNCILMGKVGQTFDCMGHKIRGEMGVYGVYDGVYIYSGRDNKVKNCIISDFKNGIFIRSSTGNVLEGNTLINNSLGIFLWSVEDNTIIHNMAIGNKEGVHLHYETTSGNLLESNTFCANRELDIYEYEDAVNTGIDNTCDKTNRWNDKDTEGCSKKCT